MLRRLVLSSSVTALLGGAAFAGGVVELDPETTIVADQGSSSKPGLVVPLLLLVLIAAAVAGGDGDGEPTETVSDRRVKTDLHWVGMAKGLPIYRYRYLGSPVQFEGVMAQDVLAKTPEAVRVWPNGLMGVDYGKLGLQMKVVH